MHYLVNWWCSIGCVSLYEGMCVFMSVWCKCTAVKRELGKNKVFPFSPNLNCYQESYVTFSLDVSAPKYFPNDHFTNTHTHIRYPGKHITLPSYINWVLDLPSTPCRPSPRHPPPPFASSRTSCWWGRSWCLNPIIASSRLRHADCSQSSWAPSPWWESPCTWVLPSAWGWCSSLTHTAPRWSTISGSTAWTTRRTSSR